ncbi:MAG: N-acetylgalactosamine-6-sulfate sulfatase [Planctomycetaceae bacterium]|nr:N-acetylgalactosamine-6-sulfate sulfatase [Planctomycetaceae bacterium]
MAWLLAAAADGFDRPRFVVIMADDLGYGDVGCYGSKRIRTPRLDQLADGGIRMTDFHSSGAVCSPTRAGLVTGRYQQRAGIPAVILADPQRPTHPHGLQERETTFAELLGQSGYATALFGKWHLGYYPKYNPVRHGFDQFRGYISGNVDFFSHVDQAGRLDWWRDDQIDDEPGYTTHLITRHAVRFIEANCRGPFCLYVAYEPPHYPYQGPGDAPIRKVGVPRGAAEQRQPFASKRRAYREMVEEMDRGIGELIDALVRCRIDQQTLVLFFSDNGATSLGSNGLWRGHKGQLWEGGHRVPCIASWPGRIPGGRSSGELSTTLDVMPTLLAAARVEPPPDRPLDGRDLMEVFTRSASLGGRRVFWGHGRARAVREGQWKLVRGMRRQRQPQLFDLSRDPGEREDRAASEPMRVGEMLLALGEWERATKRGATPQPHRVPERRP